MKKNLGHCLTGRENNFDLIRLIAAIAVIFSHSYDLTPSAGEPVSLFSQGRASIGSISVWIFFIISGLLITKSYDKSKRLGSYLAARTLRIYPALVFVTLCTVFIVGPLFTSFHIKGYFSNSSTLLYLSNISGIKIRQGLPGLFDHTHFGNTVNGSLWTLPHELLCYLLVACAGSLLSGAKFQFFILSTVIVVIIYFEPFIFLKIKFLDNAFFFLCGSLLYIFRTKIILNLPAALICGIGLVINIHFNSGKFLSLFSNGILLSYFIITIAFVGVEKLKVITRAGDFSYGIYIWGFLIQQILCLKFSYLNHYLNFFFAFCISLIIAILSWNFIEKRALSLKRKLAWQSNLSRGITKATSVKDDTKIIEPGVY